LSQNKHYKEEPKVKANLKVANISAKAGSISYGRASVPNTCYPDGAPVDVPVILINGKYEGPTLYLDAGTHGSEVGGVAVIQRITRELIDPRKLHGAIIAIPVVHIPAFRLNSGFSPHEWADVNRSYPGDPKGSMCAKIAHFVFNIAKKADYAVNFHSQSQASVAIPFSYIYEVTDKKINEKMNAMANAFGITSGRDKWMGKPVYDGFASMAPYYGIPAILVELPSQYVYGKIEVEVGIKGVLNVMKYLKMIEGEIEGQEEVPIIKDQDLSWMSLGDDGMSGFLMPRFDVLGKRVKKGEEIAVLTDVLGNKTYTIKSPCNGYIMAYSGSFVRPIKKEGGWLAILFSKT
jgi:predicted deacylase